jgi:hypothetical protein
MKNADTYIGWGDTVWAISDGNGYPYLIWQALTGEPIVDPPRSYGGGTGEVNDPYMIGDANELKTLGIFSQDWDEHFVLVSDINMLGQCEEYDNHIIGNPAYPFVGSLDGNGRCIRDLLIEGVNSYCGLFGYIDSMDDVNRVVLCDLAVIDANVSGWDNLSCVVGTVAGGRLKDISVEAARIIGNDNVGGLAGRAENCTIERCSTVANLSGGDSLGGLVGHIESGSIVGCTSEASVDSGSYNDALGGLVGRNVGTDIKHCYGKGMFDLAGQYARIGGLLGYNADGKISDCQAVLNISTGAAVAYIGGLVGDNDRGEESADILDCRAEFDINVGDSGRYIGGLVGDLSSGGVHRGSATGSIVFASSGTYIGGLAGLCSFSLKECSVVCDIIGGYDAFCVGGLVGRNSGATDDCYVLGSLQVGDEAFSVGGLGGLYYGSYNHCYVSYSISHGAGSAGIGAVTGDDNAWSRQCFWDTDVSGISDGVGNRDPDPVSVVGLTTAEMQLKSTFTDAGWDFMGEAANGTEDIWRKCVDGINYPGLRWVFESVGDFVCPDGVTLVDYSVLAEAWYSQLGDHNWNAVCDISEPNDNFIDELDLGVFTDNYLTGF